MAHYRLRYVESCIRKMLGYSPLVGIFGHRQVGKTSLAERLSDTYYTLDDKSILLLAEQNPAEFLRSAASKNEAVIIDECQLAPALFPALKEFVRVNKKPGRFILIGSVRFTSRKAIRESLTGRIVNITIPSLGSGEMCEIEHPTVLKSALLEGLDGAFKTCQPIKKPHKNISTSAANFAVTGGLPGVCFIRDERVRSAKIESQIETILERDLRLFYETTLPYGTLRRVLVELAANVGEPINVSSIQRKTRVSVNTLKKLLSAFNAMFLIEFIPCSETAGQPTIFFTDPGEAFYLAGG